MGDQGISDAFRDAELLADAVAAEMSGGAMTEVLADYERARNDVELPRYRLPSSWHRCRRRSRSWPSS